MQYADDAALAEAVKASTRYISVLVEVDWNRDGSYAHAYSDLTALCRSVSSDRQIQGDLPDEINSLTGFASAELKLTLAGNRISGELPAHQLFSPYEPDSPLYAFEVPGTPIRYSRVVQTSAGPRTIRQFTGWIRSYEIHATGEVGVVGSDVLDVVGKQVSLPLWAVEPARAGYETASGKVGAGRPISTTWAIEDIFRQLGRPTGPVPRTDAVGYVSGNGSMLPSFGYGSLAGHNGDVIYMHQITQSLQDPFVPGRYGLAPAATAGTDPSNRNGVMFATGRTISVPRNGTGDSPVTLGYQMWLYSDGAITADESNRWAWQRIYLDDAQFDGNYNAAGRVSITTYNNGTVKLDVVEDTRVSGSIARTWRYSTPLPQGWHALNVLYRFTSSSITVEIRVNGAVVPHQTINNPSGGFRYYQGIASWRTNMVVYEVRVPVQHIQLYVGPGAGVTEYIPGQEHPPLREGAPLGTVTRTYSELAFIPDTYHQDAWDVLKNIASSEFGVIHTNEYGQLQYVTHPRLRQEAAASTATALVLDDDRLLELTINPSYDHYANTISISHTWRFQSQQVVWTNESPLEFFASHFSITHGALYPLDEVVTLNTRGTPVAATPPAQGPSIYASTASAIDALDPQNTAANGWGWSIQAVWDQRSVNIYWTRGTSFTFVYVGSYLGANQPSMNLAGKKYSDAKVFRKIIRDDAEVTRRGERSVTIPDHEWRQTEATINAIGADLLADTVIPAPLVEKVSIPSDPRLQLRDVVRLRSKSGIVDAVYGQVIGIGRDDGDSGSTDTLSLRVLVTPGEWILDDDELSILDDTTILA